MTLLTLQETAERLGCSLSTLRTLDGLPVIVLSPRIKRVDPDALAGRMAGRLEPPWVIVPGTCQGCGAIVYWSGVRWCNRSGEPHRCAKRAAA